MSVLGRLHWVDKEKLTNFILACQVKNMQRIMPVLYHNELQHRTQKQEDLLIDLETFQTLFTLYLGLQALVSWVKKESRRYKN